MKILVACEESQAVTKELRRLGHEAYSCDLLECSGGHPEWHIMQDVLPLLDGDCEFMSMDGQNHAIEGKWDMLIAFPPCTDLASSGARWFPEKQADGRQFRSIAFFMQFANADCPRIAIENPIGIMSRLWRKPDQIVQPWMFGHQAMKATCLWLKNLPALTPKETEKPEFEYWVSPNGKRRMEKWMYDIRCKSVKNGERARLASKTFPGIAKAMAEQWAGRCES